MLKLTIATLAVVTTLISPLSAKTIYNDTGRPSDDWNRLDQRYDRSAPVQVQYAKKHREGRSRTRSAKVSKGSRVASRHTGRIKTASVDTPRRSMGRYGAAQIVAHPEGCPRTAFCGCGVALHIFGKPIRELWLAANWFRFPTAHPAPGMVAVRRHHVMAILEVYGDGTAKVYDPNSGGHKTRIHRRSLAGYSVRNPGSRVALLN